MKMIIAPAKKMRIDDSPTPEPKGLPAFLPETEKITRYMQSLSYEEAKKLWACNDSIAEQNYARFTRMDLKNNLTPAILAYDGIAYQYMAPTVFEFGQFDYVEDHLIILSGFYGALRPMDGVTPYRLEMQAKAKIEGHKDLYDFWGDKLYKAVLDESHTIVNLASDEYAKCVYKYLQPEDVYIDCVFAEEDKGKIVQKGVYCKMARGEMVRYMADHKIEDPEEIKGFDRLGFAFREDLSEKRKFVFIRTGGAEGKKRKK